MGLSRQVPCQRLRAPRVVLSAPPTGAGTHPEVAMTKRLSATSAMLVATTALGLGSAELASARPAYRIVNQNSHMALMPAAGATAWGTPIVQRPRSSDRTQLW